MKRTTNALLLAGWLAGAVVLAAVTADALTTVGAALVDTRLSLASISVSSLAASSDVLLAALWLLGLLSVVALGASRVASAAPGDEPERSTR